MFSIGEFSSASGLPVRTLRFYHEKGLLVPASIDRETGYRTYDLRNLEVARVIVALRRLEFSLEDIAEMLAGATDDTDILGHLEKQKGLLTERLKHYQDVVRQIDEVMHAERGAQEDEQMHKSSFEVEEKVVEPVLVAGVRMTGRYSDCGQGFATLGKRLGRYISGKPLCLFYDGEYREEDAIFEPCMPVRKNIATDGISIRELLGGRCVTLVHRGPYEELCRSYARLLKYVKDHGYDIVLPTREVYLKGPGMILRGNPRKYLTEIQFPIAT